MFIRKYWIPLLVFSIAVVGVGLYMLAIQPSPKDPIVIIKPVETLETPSAKAPVDDTLQGGDLHEDGMLQASEPPERISVPSEVSVSEVSTQVSTAPQMEYNRGAGNPSPFENVPVDLWDFEATKAAMIENINFVKANWDPKVYDREVSIAHAISFNIANAARATQLGLYTPEQALELTMLRESLLEFQGITSGRTRELREQGYTHKEAIRIAAEETLEKWEVE